MIEIEKSDTTDYSVQEEMPLQGDERKKVLKIIEKQTKSFLIYRFFRKQLRL